MNGTCFVACSTLAGRFLFGDRIVKDKNRYHLIFNSVDTSKFLDHYDDCPGDEFGSDGWTNVIQVGRFSAVKNQLFTAKIAAELKRRGRKIRFLCVGNTGNAYEEEVRKEIKELGIEEHMLLLGVRKDIAELMRQSAVFFLPSKYEGMPLVLIEAQASGLPCIAADTFSHEVDFGIGTVSWQELDEDVQRWTDLVEEAVKKPRALKEDVCRAVEEKGFDSDTFADKLCCLYKKAAEQEV
jgi:glycosyltransferase EpsF